MGGAKNTLYFNVSCAFHGPQILISPTKTIYFSIHHKEIMILKSQYQWESKMFVTYARKFPMQHTIPRHPNTSLEGILDPKNIPLKHRTSGAIWMSRV